MDNNISTTSTINIANLSNTTIKGAKIYLAPTRELAQALVEKFQALNLDYSTVEAEYGDVCIHGSDSLGGWATLAHHGSRADNPAPCVWKVNDENFSPKTPHAILVSHIDLDAIGGIGLVLGFFNPDEQEFWRAAAHIDVCGPHHINEVPAQEAARLRAFWAYNEQHRANPSRDQITDITNIVLEYFNVLNKIVKDDPEMIAAGAAWEARVTTAVEAAKVYESDNIRAFKSSMFTASSYLGTDGKIRPCTVNFNTKFDAITLAFEDGGKAHDAASIMRELFGPDAGGRAGIAGTPRGVKFNDDDLHKVIEYVENLLSK